MFFGNCSQCCLRILKNTAASAVKFFPHHGCHRDIRIQKPLLFLAYKTKYYRRDNDRDIIRNSGNNCRLFVAKMQAPAFFCHMDFAPKRHVHCLIRIPYFPYVPVFQPLLRQLHLMPVYNFLLKQTMLITYAHAVPRQVQRSKRI